VVGLCLRAVHERAAPARATAGKQAQQPFAIGGNDDKRKEKNEKNEINTTIIINRSDNPHNNNFG